MHVTHPSGNAGVILPIVGGMDALYAFPLDIFVKIVINDYGLADVESLDRALRGEDRITGGRSGQETAAEFGAHTSPFQTNERV